MSQPFEAHFASRDRLACMLKPGNISAGQNVFGQASGCLGSHVKCNQAMLVGLPPNVIFEAAATLPTVFITADTVFQHATTLQPRDRVLVHAAAGQILDTNCHLKCMMCFLGSS